MADKWLMPDYYKNFKCKCNNCRHTCCESWKIPISFNEYNRLIGMECSADLHQRIESSFVDPDFVSENCYKYISFNWLGDCPINKEGLCMLHQEAGEEYLPAICRLYPRSLKKINNQLVACCSSSCEAVIETLYEKDSLNIICDELEEKPNIICEIDQSAVSQLLQFQDILKDRNTSLVSSIKDICILVNPKQFKKDYDSSINPLDECFKILDKLADSNNFLGNIYQQIKQRYQDNYPLYDSDKEEFEKHFPKWMSFFENVINNSLLYENFPFVDQRFDQTNAYKGLCATYGLLRFISIGYTAINNDKDSLIDAVSSLFHLIDHTAFYYNVHVLADCAAVLLKL